MKNAHLIPVIALFPLAGAGCGAVIDEAIDLARRAGENREARSGSRLAATASGDVSVHGDEHSSLVASALVLLEEACELENDCYGESYDCAYAASDFDGVTDDCLAALVDYANCLVAGECYEYEDEYGELYLGLSSYYDCSSAYTAYEVACFG